MTDPDPKLNALRKAFDDGTIRFLPEFSKAEAGYTRIGSAGFDRGHDRCSDCVHYIKGGGCHVVQGDIDPEAYCEEFYADYGVFAHEHPDHVEVNQELVGRAWDFGPTDIADFVDEIEERLQQRRREPEPRSGRPTRPMLIGQSLERIAESRDCERMLSNLQTTIQVMQELEEESEMPNAESSVFRHLPDAIDQIKRQGCLTEQDAARVHNLIFDVSARAPRRGFASQMARLEEAEEIVGPSQ